MCSLFACAREYLEISSAASWGGWADEGELDGVALEGSRGSRARLGAGWAAVMKWCGVRVGREGLLHLREHARVLQGREGD